MYKLNAFSEFDADLDEVRDYITCNLQNPAASNKLLDKTRSSIRNIQENPYIHPYYHDDRIAAKGYRYATIGSYILFYRIDETNKTVHIARFIYGRRDVKNMV